MKSLQRRKIKLEFSVEYNLSTNDDEDLHKLLDMSSYVSKVQKIVKERPVTEIKEFTSGKFSEIYDLIKQMRQTPDAPVDSHGAQVLFDETAPIDDQRFQILVALMLSPQTKDETTGMCMRRLLRHPCTINNIAEISEADMKQLIYEVNFNTTKARRIVAVAKQIKNQLGGKIPETYDEIIKFDGVGEKITLLYMLIAMKQSLGIAVDVNVMRVCNRVPLARAESPARMRKALDALVPQDQWETFNHLVVGFGQQICRPNGRELCDQCLLFKNGLCEYAFNKQKDEQTKNPSKSKQKSKSKSKSRQKSISESKTKSESNEKVE